MNKKLNQWLFYYKNSLADADRKSIQVNTTPIPVEKYFIEQVPAEHAQYLWVISKDKENEDSLIDVDISPCSFQFEYEHAKGKGKEIEIVYPFWIPAKMSKDGKLFPNGKPFFVRDYLTPNPPSYYKISSIQIVDECLRKFEFNSKNWVNHWTDCDNFFKSVTNKKFEDYNLEYDKKIYVQKGDLRNLSANIINLYNNLLGSSDEYTLLNKLLGFEKVLNKQLPSSFNCSNNPLHVGQMSETFPLSVSQRQSMRVYNQIDKGDILAVNGPPGTGKTTLLQSILANSIVRTVSEDKPPELIIASSTNNQAITNILDSFNLKSNSDFSKRWLPDITSLGLYLSSNSNTKYQTCTSQFGDGFITDYESSDIEAKTKYFLEFYAKHFDKEEKVERCIKKLRSEVIERVKIIDSYLQVAKKFEENQDLLKSQSCQTIQDLEIKVDGLTSSIKNEDDAQALLSSAEEQLRSAKNNRPFFDKLFFFLPDTRIRRASAYQRALIGVKFSYNIDFSKYGTLVYQINELFIASSQRKSELIEEKSLLENLLKTIKHNSDKYNIFISDWNEKYPSKLPNLYRETGDEYRELRPIEDMSVRLDISYRFEAFWLSIHYREAEYLIKWQEATNDPTLRRERGEDTYKKKLQRIAYITPIFISTFHSLPRYATYYALGEECPYYDLFDLIIVDEAGQVSPDVSIPSFALGKKAIVVGDISQIEPVWSVEENIDAINLKSYNLITPDITDQEYEQLIDSGKLCASGNLMRLAQSACEYEIEGHRGTLLREHRRCLDSIISYSNRYVYNNQLLPKVGDAHSKKHNLPTKGFFHIDSQSKVEGRSRVNKMDASIIARWVHEKSTELEKAYDKQINEILAIVTPYKSQAYIIKRELLAIDKRKYGKLITGTVHALQGAEMEIVIFSTVLSKDDVTSFVDSKYNMLNVAISRAKHSFLVFGNMKVLDSTKNTPLGNLKKWLLENENAELSNRIVFESSIVHTKMVNRISKLDEHINILKKAFETAKRELIIVSPFISIHAIESDSVAEQSKAAIGRGVKVTVFTDSKLDFIKGKLKETSQRGRDALIKSGVNLKVVDGIHNKTLIVDDSLLVEGSFNWLSAVRDESSPFYRLETSIVLRGEEAKDNIIKAKKIFQLT